jgi:hypothetical protein
MKKKYKNEKKYINEKILNFFFILILILFIGRSFYNNLQYAGDFQTPHILSIFFWGKNDVFQYTHHAPLYPHSLYILLLPLTFFKIEIAKIIFFFFNIFFLVSSIFIMKKNYFLNMNETKVLTLIAFTATPSTNILALGNLSLAVLFFSLSYYFSQSKLNKGIYLFLSFIKYNISFIFVLYSFLKKEYKVVFYFIIFHFISTLFYFYYLNIFKFEKILDPYIFALTLVNKDETGINNGLFSIQNVLIILGIKKYYIFIFLILIILISYLFKKKNMNRLEQLNFAFIFSALLVYHGMYDFVILLPFVAYLIKEKRNIIFFYFHAFTIFFIYYLYRINQLILKNFFLDKTMSIIGCLLLATSSLLLIFSKSRK